MEQDPTQAPEALHRLQPAVRTVWTIKLAVGFGILLLAVLAYDLVGLVSGNGRLPFGFVSLATAAVGGFVCVALPRLRYRYWRYRLHTEELYLERGVFNRVRTVVPLRRIQHLDVSQDIIEREFQLSKLIVHTAGTRSSDVVLPGLDVAEANRLRDEVKNYILEDAV
jgi:membrane protein YdbS with pleckstrin-like domain